MQKNPYEILQVARHAEPEVIDAAYRRLARKYHPDTNPSPNAIDRMKDINWAYEILGDPQSRSTYDAQVKAGYTTQASKPSARSTYKPSYSQTRSQSTYQRPKERSRERRASAQKPDSKAGSLYCQACGRQRITRYVELYQNIGMLVLRSHKSIKGYLCKECISSNFWSFTLTTVILGWWGVISFIVTPFMLINNIFRYLSSFGMEKSTPQPKKKMKVALPALPKGVGWILIIATLVVGLIISAPEILSAIKENITGPSTESPGRTLTDLPTPVSNLDYVEIPTKGPWSMPDWAPDGALSWKLATNHIDELVWVCGPLHQVWRITSDEGGTYWRYYLGEDLQIRYWVELQPDLGWEDYLETVCVHGKPFYIEAEFFPPELTIDIDSPNSLIYIEH